MEVPSANSATPRTLPRYESSGAEMLIAPPTNAMSGAATRGEVMYRCQAPPPRTRPATIGSWTAAYPKKTPGQPCMSDSPSISSPRR